MWGFSAQRSLPAGRGLGLSPSRAGLRVPAGRQGHRFPGRGGRVHASCSVSSVARGAKPLALPSRCPARPWGAGGEQGGSLRPWPQSLPEAGTGPCCRLCLRPRGSGGAGPPGRAREGLSEWSGVLAERKAEWTAGQGTEEAGLARERGCGAWLQSESGIGDEMGRPGWWTHRKCSGSGAWGRVHTSPFSLVSFLNLFFYCVKYEMHMFLFKNYKHVRLVWLRG